MVVLVLFAVQPNFWVSTGIVVLLALAMFVPVKFVHPVRTERWRKITLPMALGWTLFAGWAAWVAFDPDSFALWGLVITSLWLTFAGVAQQVIYRETI